MAKRAITIVADVPSPHQNVFFDALARAGELDVEVIFCRRTMPGRAWSGEGPRECRHLFLTELSIGSTPLDPGLLPRLLAKRADRVVLLIGYYLPAMLGAGALLALLRRPWIFWTDTLPAPDGRQDLRARLRDAARALFLHRSTLCLTTGEAGRKALISHGVSEERACVSPFVVDQEWIASEVDRLRARRTELRAQIGVAADARVLLFVGQLIKRKGVDVLVDALAQAGERARELSLVIVGEGVEQDALRSQIQARGLQTRARILPYRDNAALPELWALADGFVLPARFDAWPVVIVEALSAGLPVVGTEACGSVRDLVREGVNGFRCAADDVAQLSSALERFAKLSPGALAAMTRPAREAVVSLSPSAVAREFAQTIEKAVRLHGRRA